MAPAAMLCGIIAFILFSFTPATSYPNRPYPNVPQCTNLRNPYDKGNPSVPATYTYDSSKNDIVDVIGQCSDSVRVIIKQRWTNWRGIPTFQVRVQVSTAGPGIFNLLLRCDKFYSAVPINRKIFRPVGNGLCLVKDGKLMVNGPPLFFNYRNLCQELSVASYRCINGPN